MPSSQDLHCLGLALKVGLVVVVSGWAFGTWWIEQHVSLGRHHHEVFLEHEAAEHARGASGGPSAAGLGLGGVLEVAAASRALGAAVDALERPLRSEAAKGGVRGGGGGGGTGSDAAAAAAVPPAPVHYEHHPPWSVAPGMEGTIFMSIAAYREQRGPKSIESAFAMAKHPERLYVGLYQQWDRALDPDGTNFTKYCGDPDAAAAAKARQLASGGGGTGQVAPGYHGKGAGQKAYVPLCDYVDHVTKVEVAWQDSEGPCVARANAEAMYGGQEFAMQIDAHSTFVQDWDALLLDMWAKTQNEFAVLSGYPRSESELGRQSFNMLPMICTAQMLDWSVRNMLKNTPGFTPMRDAPVRTPYFGAGLVFAKGHRLTAVPYDKHLHYLFDGEEFDLAVRLFTHGYDVYAPNETPLYHFYTSPALNHKMGIQKFWDYQWGKRFPIMFKSTRRLRHKLGIPAVLAQDPKVNDTELAEMGNYGVGTRRSVQAFLDYAGIDLVNKKVKGVCKQVRDGLKHVPWADQDADPNQGY